MKRDRNGELSEMKDKHGKFIQCYQCRKTAVKKLMIACDYCALHWHLDCLTPPMAGLPSSAKRWRCPNHIESTMVSSHINICSIQYILICRYRNLKGSRDTQMS